MATEFKQPLVTSSLPQRRKRTKKSTNDDSKSVPKVVKYEYLDHTADIQLHTWGESLQEALEGQILAMNNYQTPLDKVDIDPAQTRTISATGHNMLSLVFNFMDEFLYNFHSTDFVASEVQIVSIDLVNWKIVCRASGEKFNMAKHEQGTEVKAITYSAMQVLYDKDSSRVDVYVVVDI